MTDVHHHDHATAHQGADPHGAEHHGGNGIYIVIFFALCGLTTVSLITYTDFWRHQFNPIVGNALMLAVACVKAFLVIAYFMHLKWEKSWKYVLTIPTCLMAVFLVLMLIPDVGRRLNRYSEERAKAAAEAPKPHADAAPHATGH
jgi:cytochrome c oxidase subunit IV